MGNQGDMISYLIEEAKKEDGIVRFFRKGRLVWLQFAPFMELPFVTHGFSTRLGGVSTDEYASMNLSYSRGDLVESVDKNYEIMIKALGFKREELVFTDQTHGTQVAYADGTVNKFRETDGLITDKKGVVLTTSFADCVPLLFADPVKQAVGASHSGWKGTCGKIGAVTVQKMQERFGSRPEDIIAVIGPSICKDCYEVSEEVAAAFAQSLGKEEIKSVVFPKENGKYKLDLWQANRLILKAAGLQDENIHVAGLCTCCNDKLLFSHRASGGKRGNLNAFLGIR